TEGAPPPTLPRTHHRARRGVDAGGSHFLSTPPSKAAKAASAGKQAVAVPPAATSQRCSGCGVVVSKGVSVRWHSCPECGTSLHRDHNAAKNSERLGRSRRGGVAEAAAQNRASPGLSRGRGKRSWSSCPTSTGVLTFQ